MSDKKQVKKKTTNKLSKKVVKKTGLGRGLDALLGQRKLGNQASLEQGLQLLAIEKLQPGQYQPRSILDKDKLSELADSIKAQGIVQPIIVRKISSQKYEIIAGERRWRAAQLASMREVPVIIKAADDQQTVAMALIENIQREDLSPLEEANALQKLIDEFNLTHADAAEAVGRSRVAVSNLLRLLDLSDAVKEMMFSGLLEMGHGRCLLAVDKSDQRALAQRIIAKKMTVRQAEALVKNHKNPKPLRKEPMNKSADLLHLEKTLSEKLCTQVEINAKPQGKGVLVIHYHNADELEGILDRIK